MTLVKTDLGFLRIIQKFKIVGRETNNNKGSSSKSLSIFTTILASRIGSWQHYLKITSITLQVSMTLVKTDLGFLRIIQKFKIVGRRPTITRSYAKDKIRGFQLFKVYGNNPIRLYKFIDSSKSQFIDKDLKS
jgi:hypothetical protein